MLNLSRPLKVDKKIIIIASSLAGLLLLSGSSLKLTSSYYQQHVSPGLSLAGDSIGGITPDQLNQRLDLKSNELMSGLVFVCGKKEVEIKPTITNALGVAEEYYLIDKQATEEKILNFGHQGSFWQRFANNWQSFWSGHELGWRVTADSDFIKRRLQAACGDQERPAKEADVVLTGQQQIKAEQIGLSFDYDQAIEQMFSNLGRGKNDKITIVAKELQPTVKAAELQAWLKQEQLKIPTSSVTLKWQEQQWQIDNQVLLNFFGPVKTDGQIKLQAREDKISSYLESKIAPEINREPQEAKFEVKAGKVTIFQKGLDGQALLLADSAKAIATAISESSTTADLAVSLTKANASTTTEFMDDIVEIIGVGTSTFNGSSANRRHNIKNGANAINGIIIAPGEEFSMLKALGSIDAKNGYVTELVIKENKTIPEYGGGLCQIGTTMFRVAIDSGLPITQRRNHSYRVSYYEPAGTDATIYDPAPDFRFINDTGKNLLLQTKMSGNSLRFELWGTKDGRQVSYTKPTIYNIVKPAPTKFIQTDSLAPGKKKCTESSHNGADAYFDYKVVYPNGELKQKRFSSHYVPWQAVCLIGRTASSSPELVEKTQ